MEELSPSSICQLLFQKYGVRRLLVEGGPSVNYQFMQAQLLDELFLTLAPTLVGLRTDLTLAMGSEVLAKPREAELVSLNQHGQELFLRYRFRWSL